MTDRDRILHVTRSISGERRLELKLVFEETSRLAKLLQHARAVSKMSTGDLNLSSWDVLYLCTIEAMKRGLPDENEIESMSHREVLLTLESACVDYVLSRSV